MLNIRLDTILQPYIVDAETYSFLYLKNRVETLEDLFAAFSTTSKKHDRKRLLDVLLYVLSRVIDDPEFFKDAGLSAFKKIYEKANKPLSERANALYLKLLSKQKIDRSWVEEFGKNLFSAPAEEEDFLEKLVWWLGCMSAFDQTNSTVCFYLKRLFAEAVLKKIFTFKNCSDILLTMVKRKI